MTDFTRLRNWTEKNIRPENFKTLQEFLDKMDNTPGLSVHDDVKREFEKKYKDGFAFKDDNEYKQFKENQKKALSDYDKADDPQKELEALQKAQEELQRKIELTKQRVDLVGSIPKDTVESVKKAPVKPESNSIISRVGKFIGKLFGGNKK